MMNHEREARRGMANRSGPIRLAISLAMTLMVGCGGPSTEERMLQAARRARPKNAAVEAAERAQSASPASQTTASAAPNTETLDEASNSDPPVASSPPAAQAATVPDVAITLKPIELRRPAEKLTDQQRHERSRQNLTKISEALQRYYEDKGTYPRSAHGGSGGGSTLSWRVALLPYLGHQELYQRFDFQKPWDVEPNQSLLQYIPDEYVSPERFDEQTNYLLPAGSRFMFGEGRSPRFSQIEDGPDNTIMLVEVNDTLAVPWTKPSDFDPSDWTDFRDALGDLRSEGSFALWATGRPVLLSHSLTADQLRHAFSYEAGDGQTAAKIHQAIPLESNVTSEAEAIAQPEVPPADDRIVADETATSAIAGIAVPIAAELASAQQRLRAVYADRLREAVSDAQKRALAREMLDQSEAMTQTDAAGAYALQTAALRLSVEAGAAKELIRALDLRVAQFDVDAYEENINWLIQFGEQAGQRPRAGANQRETLQRIIHTLFVAVHEDDYLRGSELARHMLKLASGGNEATLSKRLEQLRNLLRGTQREFAQTQSQLADFRNDPSDGEAAAAVGRFLCFFKGDWETGLPLLTRGGGIELRELAVSDLRGADSVATQVALGDAWWALSQQARSNVYRQGTQDRAAHWYRLAFATLPESLDRLHVKARLDQWEQVEPASPLAVLTQLAEYVGADPGLNLAALEAPQHTPRTTTRQGGQRFRPDASD